MKRIMLATTAALTLSAHAFAQSQTELAVSNALLSFGYDASIVPTLSDAQVAELFLTVTSGDDADIRRVIDGFDLASDAVDNGLSDTGDSNDSVIVVEQTLARAGYPEATVNLLTDSEIARVYLAATSGDQSQLMTALESLEFGIADMDDEQINSGAERYVVAELMDRGVARDDVLSLTDAEFAELFIVLTSGDSNDVTRVLSSITS